MWLAMTRGCPDRKGSPGDLDDPDSSPAAHSGWIRQNLGMIFPSSRMFNIWAFNLIFSKMLKRNVSLHLPKNVTYLKFYIQLFLSVWLLVIVAQPLIAAPVWGQLELTWRVSPSLCHRVFGEVLRHREQAVWCDPPCESCVVLPNLYDNQT